MGYRDLLVVLDSDAGAKRRIELAAKLANQLGGHLTGLYATLVPELPGRLDRFNAPLIAPSVRDEQETAHENAEQVRQSFDTATARQGIVGEWRFAMGAPSDLAALHGRYADLIIVGQTEPADEEAVLGRLHPEEVALTAGRPVLIVPYAGRFETIGLHVLIGWDASRAATRAVNDALPLLVGAQSVTVLTIDAKTGSTKHGEVPGADIALHLARHGVEATIERTVSDGVDAGNILLSRAADLGADLLVIGAYGHTPLREAVFGGSTRTILGSMTLPVLLSH